MTQNFNSGEYLCGELRILWTTYEDVISKLNIQIINEINKWSEIKVYKAHYRLIVLMIEKTIFKHKSK